MNKAFLLKKAKIIIWDNKSLLFVLIFWFLSGLSVYFFILKLDFFEALKASFFVSKLKMTSLLPILCGRKALSLA